MQTTTFSHLFCTNIKENNLPFVSQKQLTEIPEVYKWRQNHMPRSSKEVSSSNADGETVATRTAFVDWIRHVFVYNLQQNDSQYTDVG